MTIGYTELVNRRMKLQKNIALLRKVVAEDPSDSAARNKMVELMADLIGLDAAMAAYTDIKAPGK